MANANAKSPLWFNEGTDLRGSLLEDAIMAHDLKILNQRSPVTTFENRQGQGTNIDVTMTNQRLHKHICNWHLTTASPLVDHRLIHVHLRSTNTNREPQHDTFTQYLNYKRANWPMFDWLLIDNIENLGTQQLTLNDRVKSLTRAITDACHGSIPPARQSARHVHWWTDELSHKRETTRKLEKKWRRAKHQYSVADHQTVTAKRTYAQNRNAYTAAVRRAKKQSWETLISQHDHTDTPDPWGHLYRIIYGKYKDALVLHSMRSGTRILHDFQQITELLLNGLLPDDDQPDMAVHQHIRRATTAPTGPHTHESFTEVDLNVMVHDVRNKKAPGFDGLRPEIIKRSYGRIR